jgi:hypothetical protein
MKRFINYKILGLALIVSGVAACDTADQDVSPIVSPDSYPVATFTASSSNTSLVEGNAITYTITIDKPLDRALTFSAKVKGGTADEHDFVADAAVLAPYTTQTQLTINAVADDFPEANETLQLEIGVFGIADKYLLNPSTVNPSLDLTIVNLNDPTLLTIAFEWPDPNHNIDIDIVTWRGTTPPRPWGDGGATGNNPEIDMSIWLEDPLGDYYVNIMDWGADPFTYKFTIGHPDGTIQIIEGTFNTADYSAYILDNWTAWGGSYESYRVLKVTNNGTGFVVTAL